MQNLRVTRVWIWSQFSVVSENHFTVISQRDFTSNFSQDSLSIFAWLNFSGVTINPNPLITMMIQGTRESKILGGKWMFCSILVFHVRDMLSSRLISDIYTLF